MSRAVAVTDDQAYTLTLYALRYALDSLMRGGRADEVTRLVRRLWPGFTAAQALVIRGEIEAAVDRSRSGTNDLDRGWMRLLLWIDGQ